MRFIRSALVVALLLPLGATPSGAQGLYEGPIFDAHIHYSQPAWASFPPEAVKGLFEKAGVTRALVSSTPDDGTLALLQAMPQMIAPELRPYREGVGSSNWAGSAETPAYLKERLGRNRYVGIGEFHLHDPKAIDGPVVRDVIALALTNNLPIHVHSDARPIEAFFAKEPRLKILWAHAGMSEPASVVAAMLGRYPNLVTEVSFRAGDIAPGGTLDPAWRELMIRFADRVMVGTDTYVTGRWEVYGQLIADHRRWLAQLPKPVADAIAHGNAAKWFGAGR
jgi:predicted TIM-barrel fold metal-dependent hydrolase